MTTPLAKRITRHIEMTGPMPLTEYMHLCLTDPTDGYYKNRQAIGSGGDFITAPETSQMFGELIGVWCLQAWEQLGKPSPFNLVEFGPGLGTLMADLLRATRISPDFMTAVRIHMVEVSENLKRRQEQKLAGTDVPITWHDTLETVSNQPLLVVANEFLDVIPIRQYVRAGKDWRERAIALDKNGALIWTFGTGTLDPGFLPDDADDEPDGAVFEYAPAREAFIENLAARLCEDTGAALIVDYGHAKSAFGDTFQAVKNHAYTDPLLEPGLADLTSHIDFGVLARAASDAGAQVKPLMDQGDFLIKLGLLERAGQLGSDKSQAVQDRLTSEAERLALPDQMGRLFKIFAFAAAGVTLPLFDEVDTSKDRQNKS